MQKPLKVPRKLWNSAGFERLHLISNRTLLMGQRTTLDLDPKEKQLDLEGHGWKLTDTGVEF